MRKLAGGWRVHSRRYLVMLLAEELSRHDMDEGDIGGSLEIAAENLDIPLAEVTKLYTILCWQLGHQAS